MKHVPDNAFKKKQKNLILMLNIYHKSNRYLYFDSATVLPVWSPSIKSYQKEGAPMTIYTNP